MAKIKSIEQSAIGLTKAADVMCSHEGSKFEAIMAASNHLSDAGYDMSNPKTIERIMSFSAGDNDQANGYAGATRIDISSQLVRDFMPETALEDNPVSDILPLYDVDAPRYQQGKYGAGYGMAQPAGAVLGVQNQVPFLKRDGKVFRGWEFTEFSELDGDAALAMRKMASSSLTENGGVEAANFATLNLINRQNTGIAARSIDALKSGSFIATKDGVVVSSQLEAANIINVGAETAGAYNKTTNIFAPNYSYASDPIQQLMTFVTNLVNTGIIVESIDMDNQMYNWMFATPAVKAQTKYSAAFSANTMSDTQKNIFRINTIPALMDIPIVVHKQGYKFAEGVTNRSNTRPLWWGEEVTPSSFRVMIKTRSPNGSPMGNLGFFPNVYKDGMFSSDTSTGIVVRAHDYSANNPIDQRYMVLTSTTYCPMVYQPNMIYLFDFNVTVTQ